MCASYCNVVEFLKLAGKPLNSVILSYLQYRINYPMSFDEIREIIPLIETESSLNFQIVYLLFQFHQLLKN